MTRNAKRYLALLGIALAVGLGVLCWRNWSEEGTAAGLTKSAATTGTSLSVNTPISANKDPREPHHSDAAVVNQTPVADTKRTPSTAGPVRTQAPMQLPVEADLIIDDGQEFKGIRGMGSDKDFEQLMERLSEQSLQEPLAIDLTALSSSVAVETSRQITGVEVTRIACGLQICMAALSAPSIEVFNKWTTRFFSNLSIRSRAIVGDNATLRDGSIEYRLLFSTDESVRRAVFQPHK